MEDVKRVTLNLNSVASAEQISLGGGSWVPSRFVARFDDPGRGAVADLEFAVERHDDDVRVMCTAIQLDGRAETEITTDDLRLPIASIRRSALKTLAFFTHGPDAAPGTTMSEFEASGNRWVGALTTREEAQRVETTLTRERSPARNITPQLLKDVAALYREAVSHGAPPRLVIAKRFTVSPLTARNWIQKARARSLLAEAPPGRAGEIPRKPGVGANKTTQRRK